MKNIAILPLRSGSKGIVFKNKKKLLGRPLYQWVLTEAIFSELTKIYVFTDDEEILNQVSQEYKWTNKVIGIKRSAESATDNASTEVAMTELAELLKYDFDNYCLLQATSPLTQRTDINNCLSLLINQKYDSCLSVAEAKRFIWNRNGTPLNYDYNKRPRRQDFSGLLVENGAIYITSRKQFQKSGIRIGGKIGIVEMHEDSLTEIDEPSDWIILESLIEKKLIQYKKPLEKIKAVIFDVDGVFTDGNIAVSDKGELFKTFSMRDGMGLEYLKTENIIPIILTSEDSQIVRRRMEKLKIKHAFFGVKDKYSYLEVILKELGLKRNQIAYVGDDLNDLPNLLSCSWSYSPINCVDEVKMKSDCILTSSGGEMAVREAIRSIIMYNNTKF